GVLRSRGSRPPGRAERGELRMFERRFCLGPSEEFCVRRIRAGPGALDETHTELVEQLRDRKFVGDGEVGAFALSAVTQGRVEYVDTVVQHMGTPAYGVCHR